MSRWKDTLKSALDRVGLLPAVAAVYGRVEAPRRKAFKDGLKFYLYNHWLTNFPSNDARLLYLRRVLGLEIGEDCFIHMGCFFEGDKIAIGHNTVIGRHCFLGGNGGFLTIRNNVSITARSYIFCASHDVNDPGFASVHEDVTIEDRAWIGAGATILPGVTIGEGAVLAAVATATKNIPEFTVWAGVPAKQIGERNRALTYTLRHFPYFN